MTKLYPAETVTDADYENDLALLAHVPAQAESLLYNQEKAARGIGLYHNLDKIETMCFNQDCSISSLIENNNNYSK